MIGTETTIMNNYPAFIIYLIKEYFRIYDKDKIHLRTLNCEVSNNDTPNIFKLIYDSHYRERPSRALDYTLRDLKTLFTWGDYRSTLERYNESIISQRILSNSFYGEI